MNEIFHEIKSVLGGSIAEELEIEAGDFLVSIDGKPIIDVLDYRFRTQAEELIIEVQKTALNEIWELEIEKDEDEDLGLDFVLPLMSNQRNCCNNCIFCFIDQQPKKLRDTLYVKDDDPRMSFLLGNYATLTNLSEAEVKRLAGYHLSPLRISVHAADLDLRVKMMGTERARNLFDALDVFSAAGIDMHFQIVLCKGINDGTQLDFSIEKLAAQKGAKSLAIVPVGLTKFRGGATTLEPFTAKDSAQVISQVEMWQKKLHKKLGTGFVFLADEWYVMAGKTPPHYESYEDFPQLDNGVGSMRLFEFEFINEFDETSSIKNSNKIGIVTGVAASEFMGNLVSELEVDIHVLTIENEFFGKDVTVSGLITGTDIVRQLQGKVDGFDVIFLPPNAFRTGTEDMLDGYTKTQVEKELNVKVSIGASDGAEFRRSLQCYN